MYIIIIIGIYIAPFPFIKCSKALRIVIDVEFIRCCGSAFHNLGALMEKARSPNLSIVRGSSRRPFNLLLIVDKMASGFIRHEHLLDVLRCKSV